MRRAMIAVFAALAFPAQAQDLPQGPKAPPPDPLPDAICDTTRPDGGDWLVGRWVMPYGRWDIRREAAGLVWTLDQKPDINASLGWKDGARIDGRVAAFSACTLRLEAGDGGDVAFAFAFDGVRTEDGKIYGYAVNRAGRPLRWTLRRER
jgi:hypothetical protein